jgi:uncharacterized damage-inducible protein DinB
MKGNRAITLAAWTAAVFMAAAAIGAEEDAAGGASPPAASVLDAWVTQVEQLVVPAADALPGERYSFAPSGGEFRGVRTFAEQVKHLAAANWQLGSRAAGETPPAGTHDETAPESIRTKVQIMEYLRGSFACLHRAASASAGAKLVEAIDGTSGTWQRTRLGLLIDAIAHSSNHYGQMAVYLRMNGIVPPASR